MRGRRAALGALGIALSAAAVILLLRQVDARELLRHIVRANPGWLLAGCGVTVLCYYIRALRWGEILSPEARIPTGRLFGATMIGFLAINTLPARLGELVRAYVLARTERIPTATVLGSVVIERIFDLSLLVIFWALSLLFAPYPDWFRWSGYLTLALAVVATVALWLLHASHYGTSSNPRGDRRPWLTLRLPPVLERSIASFTAGLRAFGRPSALIRTGGLSGAMWIVNGAIFLLVAESMAMRLPLWSPLLLSFVVSVAIMVPSSPGFIGVLEGSCVVGLALVGVDAPRGLAFGVLYHLTQVIPVVILGGLYAVRGHVAIRLEEGEVAVQADGAERKN